MFADTIFSYFFSKYRDILLQIFVKQKTDASAAAEASLKLFIKPFSAKALFAAIRTG